MWLLRMVKTMHKYFKIFLFLLFLWFLSYLSAFFFFEDGAVSGNEIVVIPIEGMITLEGEGSLFSSSTSGEALVERIEDAHANPSVKGIVLEINSPGGTVMGSKVVADALKKVEKPTVAVITEYGTSGAYWIASQADYIVADELSIVGSIGVLGSYFEFGGLLEDYNVTYQRLVTGKYKDISSPYREMSEEEEELVMERLQSIHDYFVSDVAAGRSMEVADVEKLATGLFYLGQDSVENGLIDFIGNKDYAIELTREMAGITDGDVSEYGEKESFFTKFLREYTAYSSFYIGQGIGTVLFSVETSDLHIQV